MKKKYYALRFGFLVLNLFLQKQLEQTWVNLLDTRFLDVHNAYLYSLTNGLLHNCFNKAQHKHFQWYPPINKLIDV